MKKTLFTLIVTSILVTVIGCSAWMDGITPAYIEPDVIDYAKVEPKVFTPYTSLWDAKRIVKGLDYQHYMNQAELNRLIEDDNMKHKHLNGIQQGYNNSAEELRNTLFSPTGPVSMLSAALGLGLGAFLIPRPSDKKKIAELENGKTV